MLFALDKNNRENYFFISFIKNDGIFQLKTNRDSIGKKKIIRFIYLHDLINKIESGIREQTYREVRLSEKNVLFVSNHGYSDSCKIFFYFDIDLLQTVLNEEEKKYVLHGDFQLTAIVLLDLDVYLISFDMHNEALISILKKDDVYSIIFNEIRHGRNNHEIIKQYFLNYNQFVKNTLHEYLDSENNIMYALEDIQKQSNISYIKDKYKDYIFNFFVDNFLNHIGNKVGFKSTRRTEKICLIPHRRLIAKLDINSANHHTFHLSNLYILFFQERMLLIFGKKIKKFIKTNNLKLYDIKDMAYIMYNKYTSLIKDETFKIKPKPHNKKSLMYFIELDKVHYTYEGEKDYYLLYYSDCEVKLYSIFQDKIQKHHYKTCFMVISSNDEDNQLILANGIQTYYRPLIFITIFFIKKDETLHKEIKNFISNFSGVSENSLDLYKSFRYDIKDLYIEIELENFYFEILENSDEQMTLLTTVIFYVENYKKIKHGDTLVYDFYDTDNQVRRLRIQIEINNQQEIEQMIDSTFEHYKNISGVFLEILGGNIEIHINLYLQISKKDKNIIISQRKYKTKKDFIFLPNKHVKYKEDGFLLIEKSKETEYLDAPRTK
ncbi:MAG: hypothetical protein QXF12_01330 [Candidatus Aenigmatarchaeota archaeon]